MHDQGFAFVYTARDLDVNMAVPSQLERRLSVEPGSRAPRAPGSDNGGPLLSGPNVNVMPEEIAIRLRTLLEVPQGHAGIARNGRIHAHVVKHVIEKARRALDMPLSHDALDNVVVLLRRGVRPWRSIDQ